MSNVILYHVTGLCIQKHIHDISGRSILSAGLHLSYEHLETHEWVDGAGRFVNTVFKVLFKLHIGIPNCWHVEIPKNCILNTARNWQIELVTYQWYPFLPVWEYIYIYMFISYLMNWSVLSGQVVEAETNLCETETTITEWLGHCGFCSHRWHE